MAKTTSTAELAAELEIDPRTLRRFLRSESSPVENVGKGKRYVLDARTTTLVRKQFLAWAESKGNQVTKLKDIPAQRGKS